MVSEVEVERGQLLLSYRLVSCDTPSVIVRCNMVGYRALIWGITLLGTLNQAKKLCLGTVSTCSMSFCCWRCKQLYNSAIFVINLHDVNSEAF